MTRSSAERPVTASCTCCVRQEPKKCICVSVHRHFLWPCYFGTDVPAREQLIAYNRTVEEISQVIGADSLGISETGVACVKWQETCRSAPDVLPETIRWIRRWRISEENSNSRYKEENHEYRQIRKPIIRALCKQGNAVHFFTGYEIPYLEKTLDRTG